MAGENVVGDAWVAIHPDTSAFEGALKGGLAGPLEKIAGMFGPVGKGVAVITAAVVAVGAAALDMGKKFGESLSGIQAQTGQTAKDVGAIGDAFLSTAGQTTFSAVSIANAFNPVAAQLKEIDGHALDASKSLAFMRAAMNLAEASGSDLNTTTADLAKALQAFQLKTTDSAKVADILYTTAKDTGNGLDTLTAALTRARSNMGATAPPIQALSGLLLDLTQHGETGRGAISALAGMFTGIVTPTKAVGQAQHDLGVSFKDTKGNLLPLQRIFSELQPVLKGMSAPLADATLKSLGFGSASGKLAETIQAGPAVLQAYIDQVSATGSAQVAAQTATDNLGGAWSRFTSSISDMLTKGGAPLNKFFTGLVNWLSNTAVPFFNQRLIPAFAALGRFISNTLVPDLQTLERWFVIHILPALVQVSGFIVDKVVPAISTAINWIVTNVFPVIGKIVGATVTIIGGIVGAIQKIVQSHTFKTVVGVFKDAFGLAATAIGGILTFASGLVGGIVTALGLILSWSGWKTINGIFGGAFGWIGDHILTPFLTTLDAIISDIKWIADHLSGLPHALQPGMPANGPGWQWPFHAAGGDVKAGEVSWVGEKGPELVRFGSNAHVYSNAQSRTMAGGITQTNHFYGVGKETVDIVKGAIADNNKTLIRHLAAAR